MRVREVSMKIIADISIVPIGVGVSLSKYIAECEKIFTEAGLKIKLHAYGTNIEGEWEEVFSAIKRCHERLHEMGVPRITASMRFGTRVDRDSGIEQKIKSVEEKM